MAHAAPAAPGAAAAVERFLRPHRVAVVGASRDRASIGGVLFANALAGGFQGVLYPVNPNAEAVQAVYAFGSLRDCPAVPDLAVVAVPAHKVRAVVEEAGRIGVRAVCVISAGFAEAGGQGEDLQRRLMETARSHDVRIVGPNCMGVLNAAAETRLNATFSASFPPPGRIGFLSQSGAVGLTVLDHAASYGLGLSGFVSTGNSADVAAPDLIEYWEHDPQTDVILLYLESFRDPRRFSRVARRTGRAKPIVAVKSGRTGAGERAASSHTAALAAREVAVDALFAQTGVIRTDTLGEMFEVASLLSHQPPPSGRRVGILTNGGGPGILAADACEARGLKVPRLSDATQARLRHVLPAAASPRNPVDLLASAGADTYASAAETLGTSGEVDALVAIFIPPIITRAEDVADTLVSTRGDIPEQMPLLTVFMGGTTQPPQLGRAGIPSFALPEEAVRALSRAATWSAWRGEPEGTIVRPGGIHAQKARALVDAAIATAGGELWLPTQQAIALLSAYGVRLARSEIVTTPAEAAAARQRLACPVAVKIDAPVHKSDIGGIATGLDSRDQAAEAVTSIRRRLEDRGLADHARTFVVQEMIADGVEMAVGVNQDPAFGPLLMVGLGGEWLELLGDVSVRVTPVTDLDVEAMLGSLRSRPLLTGYRGRPPADLDAFKDVLYRVNALVDDIPEIAELDLNPLFVKPHGVTGVDVRIRLSADSRS